MAEAQQFDKEQNGSIAKGENSSSGRAMTPSSAASEACGQSKAGGAHVNCYRKQALMDGDSGRSEGKKRQGTPGDTANNANERLRGQTGGWLLQGAA